MVLSVPNRQCAKHKNNKLLQLETEKSINTHTSSNSQISTLRFTFRYSSKPTEHAAQISHANTRANKCVYWKLLQPGHPSVTHSTTKKRKSPGVSNQRADEQNNPIMRKKKHKRLWLESSSGVSVSTKMSRGTAEFTALWRSVIPGSSPERLVGEQRYDSHSWWHF